MASFVVKTRFYCLIGRPKGYRIPEQVLKKKHGTARIRSFLPPNLNVGSKLCLKGDFKKKASLVPIILGDDG